MDHETENQKGHDNYGHKNQRNNSEYQNSGGDKALYPSGRPEVDERGLNWNSLRYVQRIAAHGSFLEAAEYLGRSQAHLSIKVAALEKHLGYPIFQRSDRGVMLTRKGESLLRLVTPFLHDLHGYTRAGAREDGVRTIRIVSTNAVMSYILLEPLMQYQEQHPEVRFDLVGDNIHLDLVRHDADLVVRPAIYNAPGITQIPLFMLTKKLYASQSYIDRYGEPKTVEELDQHKLITMTDKRLGPHIDTEWILKFGMLPGEMRKASHINNLLECSVAMAKRGLGILAGYPLMSVIRDAQLVNILPGSASLPVTCHLLYPNATEGDVEMMELINFLRAHFVSVIQPNSCGVQSDA